MGKCLFASVMYRHSHSWILSFAVLNLALGGVTGEQSLLLVVIRFCSDDPDHLAFQATGNAGKYHDTVILIEGSVQAA